MPNGSTRAEKRVRPAVAVLAAALLASACARASGPASAATAAPGTAVVSRGTFVREVRVTGTTEAVRAATTVAPRLAGQSFSLIVTRLVAGGTRVVPGDLLVEFDRQEQLRTAFDRRAEFEDLEQQILKKRAELAAASAADDTALTVAEHDVGRAKLDVEKNQFLPTIDAEKNTLALEQATARLAQLRQASALKTRSAAAEIAILEIRRDRARRAWRNAETNVEAMIARAPFAGLAILKQTFKGSQMAEVQEGDEVYAGTPVVDVVDPALMQVRARIVQTDGGAVAVGQAAKIRLDAYPDLVFDGRVAQVAPLASTSQLTARVRQFGAVIAINGSHEKLLPDLSAAVDITVDRQDGVLRLPRDAVAVGPDGAWVQVTGSGGGRRAVTLGAIGHDTVVVTSGLADGTAVVRRPAEAGR